MSPERKKDVFIHDVARAAGCSISTVSKALNNTGSISEKKKALIVAAAERLGYSPHPGARFLRGRRSENIGLVYSAADLFRNPFYSAVGAGVEEVLAGMNYNLLLAAPLLRNGAPHPPKFVRERSVDGILVIGSAPAGVMHHLAQSGLPLVLIDTEVDDGIDSFVSDGYGGARLATEHLLRKGHRRIGMLRAANEDIDINTRRRFEGFAAALKAAGLPLDPQWIAQDRHGQEGGRRALRRILDAGTRPTALFAVNDEMAIGAIGEMRDGGIDVPGEVSVIGFDDIQLASMTTPGLTTIRVDMLEMGRAAARLLLEKLRGEGTTPRRRVMPVALVERGTVRSTPP